MASNTNVIDLPRGAGGDDLLGVDRYVEALLSFLRTAQMPITMAIQGEWGSGKTSLMNQVLYKLCETLDDEPDSDKPYYGIWINTWQYSLMRSKEEALVNVIKGVTEEVMKIIRRRHMGALGEAMGRVSSMFGKLARAGAKAAVSVAGADASLVDELISGSDAASPLIFRQALSDAICECLNEDRKAGKKRRGFLFFIDDLDRLDPTVAVQILELLKNLFEVENSIFILAIDYDVVVKGLVPKFGPLTEKNEREFRSFFDKIIQLPFSMPISNYKIDTYLASSLAAIGYFDKYELKSRYGEDQPGEDRPLVLETLSDLTCLSAGTNPRAIKRPLVVEILSELTRLSAGTNPRAIKRLINCLSLIQIMHKTETENAPMTVRERLINFGFVGVQIAYPTIYNVLLYEPNFKTWDESVAERFRAGKIEAEMQRTLDAYGDLFDEEWEQVLYRICQNSAYMEARAYSISRLLNLIAALIGETDTEKFGDAVSHILNFAAVTTVTSEEKPTGKSPERMRLANLEAFLELAKKREVRPEVLQLIAPLLEKFREIYGELIRIEFGKRISVNVTNTKSRARTLVAMDAGNKSASLTLRSGDYTHNVRTFEPGQKYSLPEDFFQEVNKLFAEISTDEAPELGDTTIKTPEN